jgi:hypothetical protein
MIPFTPNANLVHFYANSMLTNGRYGTLIYKSTLEKMPKNYPTHKTQNVRTII